MGLLGWDINGSYVDHRNNVRLDCRVNNLRLASHANNNANVSKNKRNTSGFKGVHFHKKNKRYIAYCGKKHVGSFLKVEDAAAAYNKAARKKYGRFARLNSLQVIETSSRIN